MKRRRRWELGGCPAGNVTRLIGSFVARETASILVDHRLAAKRANLKAVEQIGVAFVHDDQMPILCEGLESILAEGAPVFVLLS